MSNFWGAINAIRREATRLRTDPYLAGCFTAQEAAMEMDRAATVLEAAGKVGKERAVKYMSYIGIGAYETDGESTFYPPDKAAVEIRALLSALPDEVKK